MFKVCKYCLYDSKSTDDLCNEEDEQPDLACTSQLQRWHKKGRGEKISALPVMEVTISKTKLDETRGREGVKCLLYEARANVKHDFTAEMNLKKTMQEINSGMGLAIMANDDSSLLSCVETKFGKSPVGSFCSYQLTHTEANFMAFVDISSVQRESNISLTEFSYPRFPLRPTTDYVLPDNLDVSDEALINSLVVDEMVNSIESATRDQFQSQRWKEERRFRLTSSKFDLIVKRKRNFEKFATDLINPKEFTSRYVAHGIKNEPVALEAYEKLMFTRKTPVKVLKCGFVVCQDMPNLGSSPDGRVVDFGCQDHFGVAEVKCPETKYHVTPLDACQDPNFFCEAVNGQCKLKRTHSYFAQVQGHMGVTGASWCDFIVYTKKGISVERILFDAAYWTDLKQRLHSFYFTHFIKTASSEFAKN